MKTKIFILIFVFMASISLYAQSGTCGPNLTWTLQNGVLTISGSGNMNDYSWNGAPWYSYRESISSVIIGNSVTSIGRSAFYDCSGLTSITIPNSVTSIGSEAFYDCSGLTSITIPNSVINIGEGAFRDCSALTSVTIPNSVTSIGNYAFLGCSALTSVTIPNSVTSIGEDAFYRCSALTSPVYNAHVFARLPTSYSGAYTIPNGIVSISGGAFSDCSGLTSVTIGNSVTSIGNYAFYGCSGLTFVTIPNSVTSIGNYTFSGCSTLTSVTIPNSVTSIGYDAFDGCSGLTSVTIPNSVISIGNEAFGGCSGLTSVTIPNSVISIGNEAFRGCSSLTSVTINSNDIVGKAYSSSKNLKSIFGSQVTEYIIGNSVISIGDYAFRGCSGLTSVTIGNSVTSIGDYAFYGCSGLTSITIPDSVISIGDYAFYGCSGLTSVTIPNSVTSIGNYAFSGCSGLTSFTCYAVNRPDVGSSSFSGFPSICTLYVLNEVLDYYAWGWDSYFSNIRPITTSVTIGSTGWASFSHEYPLDFTDANCPDGLTAYQVQATNISSADNTIAPSTINTTVAANTGLLLNGEEGTYDIIVASSGSDLSSTNKLVAVTEDGTIVNNQDYYVLMNDNGTAVFAHTGEHAATLNKGKAYLDLSGIALAPGLLRIVEEESGVTDIHAYEEGKEAIRKFVDNGRLYILCDGITYDALGRRVR